LSGDSDLPARLTAPASGLFLERVYYSQPESYPPLIAPLFRLPSFTQVPPRAQN